MQQDTTNLQKETVIFDGKDYFDALICDIGNAKKTIDLETYIFTFDALGQKVLAALTAAVKRGVMVKILIDGAGNLEWTGKEITQFEAAGGQWRIFHSFPWRLLQWSYSYVKGSKLRKAIYLLLHINARNHRKVCIIDKKIVYIGSYNIRKESLDNYRREVAVRLQNYDFHDLQRAFEAAWSHRNIAERVRDFFHLLRQDPIIRLNNTWYRRHFLYKNLLRRIRNCKKRVWITNAYFVPDNLLLRRLKAAAKNGVDVRILLPRKTELVFMSWASRFFYAKLLKSGVKIYEYLPGILHAKTLILDDWMLIGSSNLTHRSILHDLEVDVNIRTLAAKQSLEKLFLADLEQSKKVQYGDWNHRPLWQRMVGKLILCIKYWF